jgi:phage gp46-like protein
MDIKLSPDEFGVGNIELTDNDVTVDNGLNTAVYLSLFTDIRVDDETLLDDNSDKRGYWGDVFDDKPMGSKLWLLAREKKLNTVLEKAKIYCVEALKWLIDDGIAKKITINTEAVDGEQNILGIEAIIQKPSDDVLKFQYFYNWQSQKEGN